MGKGRTTKEQKDNPKMKGREVYMMMTFPLLSKIKMAEIVIFAIQRAGRQRARLEATTNDCPPSIQSSAKPMEAVRIERSSDKHTVTVHIVA